MGGRQGWERQGRGARRAGWRSKAMGGRAGWGAVGVGARQPARALLVPQAPRATPPTHVGVASNRHTPHPLTNAAAAGARGPQQQAERCAEPQRGTARRPVVPREGAARVACGAAVRGCGVARDDEDNVDDGEGDSLPSKCCWGCAGGKAAGGCACCSPSGHAHAPPLLHPASWWPHPARPAAPHLRVRLGPLSTPSRASPRAQGGLAPWRQPRRGAAAG